MPCNRYTLFCLLVGKNLVLCSMYQNSSWFGPPCSVFQVTSPECRHWFVFFFFYWTASNVILVINEKGCIHTLQSSYLLFSKFFLCLLFLLKDILMSLCQKHKISNVVCDIWQWSKHNMLVKLRLVCLFSCLLFFWEQVGNFLTS